MDECIICLDELKKNIVTLSCNHKFHYKCINNWTKRNKKNTNFPLCVLCNTQKEIINLENFKRKNILKCCTLI